jgi:hypothetical protein
MLHPGSDGESRAWLQRLRCAGRERDEARRELRELLLRAARFELHRQSATLAQAAVAWGWSAWMTGCLPSGGW